LIGQGAIVEAIVLAAADIGAGARGTGKMNGFCAAVRRQHIHRDETRAEQAEDDRQELCHVGEMDDDPVTRLQPQCDEAGSGDLGFLQQLGGSPAALAIHHRNLVRALLYTAAQHGAEGVTSPVSGMPIFVRKILRPGLLRYCHGCFSSRGTPCSSMPSASRSARNFAEVSCASASGSEPATIPAPA